MESSTGLKIAYLEESQGQSLFERHDPLSTLRTALANVFDPFIEHTPAPSFEIPLMGRFCPLYQFSGRSGFDRFDQAM